MLVTYLGERVDTAKDYNIVYNVVKRQFDRDQTLISDVYYTGTLKGDNLKIPVDRACRILVLAYMMDDNNRCVASMYSYPAIQRPAPVESQPVPSVPVASSFDGMWDEAELTAKVLELNDNVVTVRMFSEKCRINRTSLVCGRSSRLARATSSSSLLRCFPTWQWSRLVHSLHTQ